MSDQIADSTTRCPQCGGIRYPTLSFEDYGRTFIVHRSDLETHTPARKGPFCLCAWYESCDVCRPCFCYRPAPGAKHGD